ncbi:MAG: isoamylase [Steroidobacteraceae bacterium]
MSTARQIIASQAQQPVRTYATRAGSHLPLGASVDDGGVNFSLFTRTAAAVELRLYEDANSPEPFQVVALDPEIHRTLFCWHVYLEKLSPGVHYTWRVADAQQSLERAPELFDPWARAASDCVWDRHAAMAKLAGSKGLRAVVPAPVGESLDGLPIAGTVSDAVIYEMHVGGFTRHASSGVQHPGTFSGLIEKIPYLKALGVTHVELLPVMAFDEQDVPASAAALGLKNYWGYSTYGFYAPHPHYCVTSERAPQEFRDCVRALHQAGIRVLLDVVFNHTAEGGATGPTINFKALVNDIFYHHEPHDPNSYRDFTGCGNTVNCNHPLVTNFILRCLEYWTNELGVDGFRFDLASVFSRGEDGAPLANPPLTWGIELSHPLARRPIIAEAWDAAGLYQVGSFPGLRWAEWNGRYRDLVRRFVRSEPGLVGELAARLSGSQDMYGQRTPWHSINFVTCHDGFTLHDLVSYDGKHNEANGENNRDGNNDNLSWNCGVEGETTDASVLELRRRQAKNFMAILMLSQGVPMILSGDEVLRTQAGNNNAYSHDNALSWFDWRLVDTQSDMLRFTRELIALRKRHPSLRRQRFLTGRSPRNEPLPDVAWHGERLNDPRWHDREARLLAWTLAGAGADEKPLHIILNMWWEPRTVDVPNVAGATWRVAVDTALASPDDVRPLEEQTVEVHHGYVAQARSVVVLEAHEHQ